MTGMQEFFRADFFIGNRQKLLEETSAEIIVLTANGLLQRSADVTYHFRQDSNFWYLTGINEPDFILVITKQQSFLITPKRAEHRDLWDGEINDVELKRSGVSEILENQVGWTKLDLLIKKHKKVYTLTPHVDYFEHLGFYANPARGVLLAAITKHRNIELVDIRKTLARMRQVKQACELKAIQRAIDITAKSLVQVKTKLSKYKYEYEVSADIIASFIKQGARGHGYEPIIASGKNAATIHYIDNHASIRPGDLLLMDVGAEIYNYGADITRTYSVSQPTKRQKDVHQAVLDVRQKALKYLKPRVDMKKYEALMDRHMAKELKKLGLLSDLQDRRKLKKYYPHLTSHFLGLDTHDAADYERPLEPGMVLTVEPGIYIPEEGIGIRIEDDVLITPDGCQVLSASLPVTLG